MMAGNEAAKMVAGHRLRAGYCTEAATVGMQPHPNSRNDWAQVALALDSLY